MKLHNSVELRGYNAGNPKIADIVSLNQEAV